MELIHRGVFYSRECVKWEVRLYRRQEEGAETVGELSFPGSEPLLIEWPSTKKESVLCSSRATLKLLSPGDRTYVDLWSEEVGAVRLDVLKSDLLYWSGVLDAEFYEEPYSTPDGYEVCLTFSDFGLLGRVPYGLTGMKTLREVLDYSLLEAVGLNVSGVDEGFISTEVGGVRLSLSALRVCSDNFYDEDGEAMTLHDVLEGVLQPLALRLIQRGGTLWVYDLNGLYAGGSVEKVEWMSDDQMLQTDSVYNNARVTWSPYVAGGDLLEKGCYDDDTDVSLTALNRVSGMVPRTGVQIWSYHHSGKLRDWVDATDCGFTLWTKRTGVHAELLDDAARFFRIVAQEDGEESEGVALRWPGVDGHREGNILQGSYGLSVVFHGCGWTAGWIGSGVGVALWKSEAVWLPPVGSSGDALCLRVCLNLLMDCRFNPFEGAAKLMSGYDQSDWVKKWDARGNFVYIPVTLKWRPDGSDVVWCWSNQDVVSRPVSSPVRTVGETLGRWVEYDESEDQSPSVYGYLCWYQPDDRAEKCGVLGWKKNRPCITPHTEDLTTSLSGAGDGQLVPYPTAGGSGGSLWLEVRSEGWLLCDGDKDISRTKALDTYGLWSENRTWWCLMQLPEIEVQHARQYGTSLESDDVEYIGVLNGSAKEDLEISTVCGSVSGGMAMARGCYYVRRSGQLEQLESVTRGGRSSVLEELLLGTLYSQYAERRTKLMGTAQLPPRGLCQWREAMQGGKRFVATGLCEDAEDDTCEIELTEYRPDEYDREG